MDETAEFSMANVYNTNGQLVASIELQKKNLNRFALNVEKGVYLVQLIGENQIITEKVIIK